MGDSGNAEMGEPVKADDGVEVCGCSVGPGSGEEVGGLLLEIVGVGVSSVGTADTLSVGAVDKVG